MVSTAVPCRGRRECNLLCCMNENALLPEIFIDLMLPATKRDFVGGRYLRPN
jgi:hypothetical protein